LNKFISNFIYNKINAKIGFMLPERVSRTVQLIKDEASRLSDSELTQGEGAQFTNVETSSLVLS